MADNPAQRSTNPHIEIGGRLYPADRTLTDEDIDAIEATEERETTREFTQEEVLAQAAANERRRQRGLADAAERQQAGASQSNGMIFALVLDIIDPLLGLIPVYGDAGAAVLNLIHPLKARFLDRRVGNGTFVLMLMITTADFLLGLTPGIGDLLDIFPSNLINQWIINRSATPTPQRSRIPGAQRSPTGSEGTPGWQVALMFILLLIGAGALLLFGQNILSFVISPTIATIVVVIIGIAVLIFLWRLFTNRERGPQRQQPSRYYLEPQRRSHIGILLLILFVVIIAGFSFPGPIQNWGKHTFTCSGGNPNSPMAKWCRNVVAMTHTMFNWVSGGANWSSRFFERQIAYAEGDYYTGSVDANAKKKLGVYLEDIRPSAREFEDTEAVTVWGTLTAQTLDPDQQLSIQLDCHHGNDDPILRNQGRMDPAMIDNITNLDRQDLTCEFSRGEIQQGSDTVTMTATFPFTTQAYLKTYFMDKQRVAALRQGGKDPLEFYNVQDTNPTAIYTNGPAMIGMETLEPLVGLSDTQETKFRIGITLDNQWEGKIKKLNDLTIKIPPSMELVDCDANKNFRKVEASIEESENGKYLSVYKLMPTALLRMHDLEAHESFACRVSINSANRQAVLGNVPLATQYVKVIADYDYALPISTTVTVKPSSGFNVYLSPSEAPLRDDTGRSTKITCTGRDNDMNIVTASYQFLKLSSGNADQQQELTGQASTTCGSTCKVPYTLNAQLQAGDSLLCRMQNPVFESQSDKSLLRKQCGDSCASHSTEGNVFNQCMADCQNQITNQEFSSEDTLRIVNSKPVLEVHAPETVQRGKPFTITIVVTDPDLNDKLGIGSQYTGLMITNGIDYDLQCMSTAEEERCTKEISLYASDDDTIKSITASFTPTDGHTTGRQQQAIITLIAPAPPPCNPQKEVCPSP